MDVAVKVRLLTRWNGYLPNEIVSLSDARAETLEKEGIGRVIDRPEPVEAVEAEKPEPVEAAADEAPNPKPKPKKK